MRQPDRSFDAEADVSAALDAMNAEELRAFILETLAVLDGGRRGQIEEALFKRAARGAAGWHPRPAPSGLIPDLERFVATACRLGSADPSQVDEYLREGVKASLAADHQTAKAIFRTLLTPISQAGFDLGQDELIDEVLAIDVHECAVRYILAVYSTTPLQDRADGVLSAIEFVHPVASVCDPIAAMEQVLAGPLRELEAFLPAWVRRLERVKTTAGDWESDHDRSLREAITRSEGIEGLERLARSSRRQAPMRAWCAAVVETGDWNRALRAYEDAATLVTSAQWVGDFVDGAALAAQQLGLTDATERLEAAWLAAPSLTRLLRWLDAGAPDAEALRRRASSALKQSPPKSPRLLGVLSLVAGDVASAAALLKESSRLGWSSDAHPGHILFPVFAWLLGADPSGAIRDQLTLVAEPSTGSVLDYGLEVDVGVAVTPTAPRVGKPRLPEPSLVHVLLESNLTRELTSEDRAIMLDAMRAAATGRIYGVLGEKRRRQYSHAAALVACCVALERSGGKTASTLPDWVAALGQEASRFPAFQKALRAALDETRLREMA